MSEIDGSDKRVYGCLRQVEELETKLRAVEPSYITRQSLGLDDLEIKIQALLRV